MDCFNFAREFIYDLLLNNDITFYIKTHGGEHKIYLSLQKIGIDSSIIFLSLISFLYLFGSDAFGEILSHFRNILGFINLFLSFFTVFMLIGFYTLVKK